MTGQYETPLSSRYASQYMLELFSADTRYRTWRKLWVALAKAEMELGLPVTQEQVDEIEANKGDTNWWKVYGEGEIGTLEGLIYSFELIDEINQLFPQESAERQAEIHGACGEVILERVRCEMNGLLIIGKSQIKAVSQLGQTDILQRLKMVHSHPPDWLIGSCILSCEEKRNNRHSRKFCCAWLDFL